MVQRSIIIEPGRTEQRYWIDIWSYRELFRVLAWRDLAVRYKQTAVGVMWALIRPLLTMIVFTIVFGRIAKFPSEGDAPYALMVLSGIIPWTFFSTALAEAANSLVNNTSLITKVYFPRIIVPVSAVVVAFVDGLVSFVILLGLMVWYEFLPDWHLLLLPIFAALGFATTVGPAIWLASLNVMYRDFRYVIPFIIQFGLYISPVGFSSTVVPASWQWIYALNPLVGVIEGFRWSILRGQSALNASNLIPAILISGFFLWFGISQFRKMERSFADLI